MAVARPLFGEGYPLFEGSISVDQPVPTGVNIGGHPYIIDTLKYRRYSLETIRDGVVTSGEPDDQLFDSKGAWWRYRSDWSSGAGQQRLDLGQTTDAARFWRSRGVDVWDEFEAKLLPATSEVRNITAGGTALKMIVVDTFVYYSDGTDVFRSSDLSSWDAVTGLTGSINDLAGDGTDCYIATSDELYRVTPASLAATTVTADTTPAGYTTVAFAGNRLLASFENVLYEIGDTTNTLVLTHRQEAFRWHVVFSIGSRIYAGGYAGNRSELLTLQTLSDGSLAPGPEAAPFGPGELLNAALSYGGAALLGTSLGVRFAQVGGDGSLTYGPLIDAPGDVRCLTAEGQFAWFGWSEFIDSGSGVGRLDLANQPATLQPAYASDVFTAAEGTVRGVARFNNRTLFLVDEEGIYASSTSAYVAEGYIDVGDIYFGTIERKALTQLQLRFAQLITGQSFDVDLADENGTSLGTGTIGTVGAEGLELDLEGTRCDFATFRITLNGPGTSTPTLRLWRLRAYAIAPTVHVWEVPLILAPQWIMGDGEGQVHSADTLLEFEFLAALCESKEVVGYREGDRTYRVRINKYLWQMDERSGQGWRDDGKFFNGTMTLELYSV